MPERASRGLHWHTLRHARFLNIIALRGNHKNKRAVILHIEFLFLLKIHGMGEPTLVCVGLLGQGEWVYDLAVFVVDP